MSKNADWGQATTLCPPERYGSQEWLEHYEANPDILTKMLGDLYRVYKSEESKAAGTANRSGGRRKAHINGNLDELWSIITPRFSVQPFHVAFAELKGRRSLRQFATKCGLSLTALNRLVHASAGDECERRRCLLTRYDLEAIAKAGGVHPAYFREYRALIVQDLITEMFTNQPNLSISVLRALSI